MEDTEAMKMQKRFSPTREQVIMAKGAAVRIENPSLALLTVLDCLYPPEPEKRTSVKVEELELVQIQEKGFYPYVVLRLRLADKTLNSNLDILKITKDGVHIFKGFNGNYLPIVDGHVKFTYDTNKP